MLDQIVKKDIAEICSTSTISSWIEAVRDKITFALRIWASVAFMWLSAQQASAQEWWYFFIWPQTAGVIATPLQWQQGRTTSMWKPAHPLEHVRWTPEYNTRQHFPDACNFDSIWHAEYFKALWAALWAKRIEKLSHTNQRVELVFHFWGIAIGSCDDWKAATGMVLIVDNPASWKAWRVKLTSEEALSYHWSLHDYPSQIVQTHVYDYISKVRVPVIATIYMFSDWQVPRKRYTAELAATTYWRFNHWQVGVAQSYSWPWQDFFRPEVWQYVTKEEFEIIADLERRGLYGMISQLSGQELEWVLMDSLQTSIWWILNDFNIISQVQQVVRLLQQWAIREWLEYLIKAVIRKIPVLRAPQFLHSFSQNLDRYTRMKYAPWPQYSTLPY